MDKALVPHAKRLRIGRSNFRLLSDIKSKESTFQLVYNVLRLTSFFKAFLVTADVLKIYMQKFWATATVHHHSIWFKMDNKKHIVNLESFREMLHICPRLSHQPFVEQPFEEEILAFLRFLGHSGAIRRLIDVEHKDTKKSNEMYYPRFTKVIIHHFMSKDPSIPRRNNVNWHYVRDDHMFTTIKLPKASVRKTRSSSDTTITPPTAVAGDDKDADEGDDGEGGGDNDEGQDDDDAQDNDDQEDEGNDEDDEEEGSDDEQASDEEEFIHPSLSTHAEEESRDKESFDPIPKTPKNSDDEGNGEENLGTNVGREEGHDEEKEEDELYRDVNINLGRGMESIFETTSQMDVQIPTLVAPLPMSAPTLTPSTIATITTTIQAPTPPTTSLSTLLQDLLDFSSLFGFDNRLKTLEANFSEFMQTNQFAGAVSSILGITSYAVAANLSEMELNKILIEKMKGNKFHRSNEQRNLYKALVEAYESNKIILDTYGDTVTLKRRRDDDADKDKEPSAGPNQGSKRCREGKEPESASKQICYTKEPMQTTFEMEEPSHPEFETGADDQPIVESSQYPEWFSQQKKPPTLDRDWNKTLSATHKSIKLWISELAKQSDSRSSFNELMDTPVDFSNFLMNRLKVDTLTPELLAGPTYELIKGSCKSLVELKFFLEEVYKAITDQLDWVNPEGQQYPHNLLKHLPLIPNNRGRRVLPFDHFINNDLEYLRGGASSRKYTTSVTKTKAVDYGHIKWIEDLVPRTMWIQEPIGYDKHALWGISHWGRKRQQFYSFAVNRESARDVHSKRRIIAVTKLKIFEWHNYKHLDWITVRRDDDKLYK
nr:hypothetical protein [Tanacetum cinerariifolium]